MATFAQDCRHALRALARERGFTIIAVLTLALGIGASTAIFTVVDGVLLRPLPYPDPDRIAQLHEISDEGRRMNVPEANYTDWKQQSRSFDSLAGHSGIQTVTLTGGNEPVRAAVSSVTAGFFDVLRVPAHRGRTLLPEDHRRGIGQVAVVSHGLWQRALGGNPRIDGLALRLGDTTLPVVGVMPAGFNYPPGAEVWLPAEPDRPFNPSRSAHNLRVIGRLAPGVSVGEAGAEIGAIARRIHAQHSDVTAVDAAVLPLRDHLTARVRPALLLLLGAVGTLLLIACANVANLLLAQATARERELALRTALGASRWHLLRQSVTQTTVLAVLGGIVGVLVAVWGVDAMLALGSGRLPRSGEIGVDGRVLVFALAVSLATGVVLGIVPAARSLHRNLHDVLREGAPTHSGGARHRLARGALVVAQIAMTLTLLVGGGLLARSFWRTLNVDLGFHAGDQLAVDLLAAYPETPEQRQRLGRFHRELQERIAALPGVTASGGINDMPLSGSGANGRFLIEGGKDSGDYWPNYRVASPGYFAAMGIPLLAGRLLDGSDGPGTPHVAVVSRRVVDRVWPGENPIGKRINYGNMDGDHDHWITVVGVVGDVRHDGPQSEPNGEVYLHYQQRPQSTSSFTTVVRTSGHARDLIPTIRRHAQELDARVSPAFRTVEEYVAAGMADRRFNLTLVGVLGGTALVLAMLGVYGVVTYSVTRRTHEIGIRMALGASRGAVIGQFVREGGLLVAGGVALGLVAAAALSRSLASLLYATSTHDPLTFAAVPALLAAVALVACYLPARRATLVNPMEALRRD